MLARVAELRRNRPLPRAAPAPAFWSRRRSRTGSPLRFALDRTAHDRRHCARGTCRASRSPPAVRSLPSRSSVVQTADRAKIFVVGSAGTSLSALQAQAEHLSGRHRGVRRPARRGADAGAEAASSAMRCEFRGVGGYDMAAEGCHRCFGSTILPSSASPASPQALAEILSPHSADARAALRREAGRAGDHRLAGFHPPRGARGCARSDRRFRSSITSRRRSGPGGRAGRAPCAVTSIMCWRCCRSSRRCTGSSAAALHLCRPSAGRADRRASSERGEAARRISRHAVAAGAARKPAQRDPRWRPIRPTRSNASPTRLAARHRDSDHAASAGRGAARTATWPRAAANRGRDGGQRRSVPQRARGARQVRHGHAGACGCGRADGHGLQGVRARRRDRAAI